MFNNNEEKLHQNAQPWYKDLWVVFLILYFVIRVTLEFWISSYLAFIILITIFVNSAYFISYKTNNQLHEKLGGKIKGFIVVNIGFVLSHGVILLFSKMLSKTVAPLIPNFSDYTKGLILIAFIVIFFGLGFYSIEKSLKK